jgi:ferredoxin
MWLVALVRAGFPGRFLLARMTGWKPFSNLLEKWFFEGDDMVFLPADRVVRVDRPVDDPGQTVLPSQMVEHFIKEANYHWIMHTCICREASHCRDYPVDYGCLFLGQAALGINPALGRRVTQDEALQHVKKCGDAGLVHLIGRNKLDTVWLGIGPVNRLLTICSCCPCCCLWKMLPVISTDISSKVKKLPGVVVKVITDACTGCGICGDGVCFVEAISMVDGTAVIGDRCRGCGRCAATCPMDAIKVEYDSTTIGSSIGAIGSLVDVK